MPAAKTNYTEFGVVRITTRPTQGALHLEFVSSLNGSTLDQFTVYKSASGLAAD